MTPLYKVLTEGNKPSLPRFIGNWIGFFNPDAGLVSRMQFLRQDLRRSCVAAHRPSAAWLVCKSPWIPASPTKSPNHHRGTSFAYMFHEETRPLRPQTIS